MLWTFLLNSRCNSTHADLESIIHRVQTGDESPIRHIPRVHQLASSISQRNSFFKLSLVTSIDFRFLGCYISEKWKLVKHA